MQILIATTIRNSFLF